MQDKFGTDAWLAPFGAWSMISDWFALPVCKYAYRTPTFIFILFSSTRNSGGVIILELLYSYECECITHPFSTNKSNVGQLSCFSPVTRVLYYCCTPAAVSAVYTMWIVTRADAFSKPTNNAVTAAGRDSLPTETSSVPYCPTVCINTYSYH